MRKRVKAKGLYQSEPDPYKTMMEIPGAFWISLKDDKNDAFIHSCPCGCKRLYSISLHERENGTPLVALDYNNLSNAEILFHVQIPETNEFGTTSEAHWEGFLRNGYWEKS
jgi:hypothetical protein